MFSWEPAFQGDGLTVHGNAQELPITARTGLQRPCSGSRRIPAPLARRKAQRWPPALPLRVSARSTVVNGAKGAGEPVEIVDRGVRHDPIAVAVLDPARDVVPAEPPAHRAERR